MTAAPLTPDAAAKQTAADIRAIRRALRASHGSVRAAAVALGKSYSALQRRITALGLRAELTAAYPRSVRQPKR
jgi:hypothetical protein